MSFDRSTFNQNGFNLLSSRDIELSAEGVMTFDCICKAFDNLYFNIAANEDFLCEAKVLKGFTIEASGSETFEINIELDIAFNFDEEFAEVFYCESELGYNLFLETEGTIKLESESTMTQKIFLDFDANEIIDSIINVIKRLVFDLEFFCYLDAVIGIENVEEKILTINVTIPPGKKLIIDARNYTAYLDGVNVLDKVTGDWPDEISRDTNAIMITCPTSKNLKTVMLYDELYL